MSIEGMPAFVYTVELGSFTAASQALGLSKSAAAKSVARLEERLGVQLLLRTTRSVTLTDEGEVFFQKSKAILEDIEAAEASMNVRRREVSGALRVSLPVSFGRLWVAPVLTELTSQYPSLVLNLSFTDRFVDLVEEGIDLSVRIGTSDDSATILTRKLADQKSILCAAPAYIERYGEPDKLEALASHRCILFEHGGRLLPWDLENDAGEIIEQSYAACLTVNHGEALLDAALAGQGIARLSTWLAGEHLSSGALVPVLSFSDRVDRSINLLWPRRRDHAPKIRVAIDALVARFRSPLPWHR
tara:strand:+ start:16048 stop:16953 length:906 start_codon:yes stop_codon:yes gene_type:complete